MSVCMVVVVVWRRAVLTNRLSGTVRRWRGFHGLGGLHRIRLAISLPIYLYRPLAWLLASCQE